jgi:hypothetical protein
MVSHFPFHEKALMLNFSLFRCRNTCGPPQKGRKNRTCLAGPGGKACYHYNMEKIMKTDFKEKTRGRPLDDFHNCILNNDMRKAVNICKEFRSK